MSSPPAPAPPADDARPDDDATAGAPDAVVDAPGDAVVDAPGDAVVDAPGDAASDVPGDAAVDAAPDAGDPTDTDDVEPAGEALPDVIYLDRIGTPGADESTSGPSASGPATVVVVGVPESARQRMLAAGSFQVTEDRDKLADAHLVLVSTRMPKGELSTLLASLRGCPAPLVALAHTGGEALAVDVVRAGGRGVVAEGNERALLGYAFGEAVDTSLIETYDRQVARSRAGEEGGASHDPVTNLPGASAFTRRLTELGQTGDVPRIGFLQVLNLDRGGRSLSPQGLALLRRRLALQFRKLAGDADVELFAMTDIEFALLSPTLSPNRAEQLGHRMARVTEMFAPMGSRTLGLAVGHAGPEVSGELSMLRELAHRAMAVAASHEASGVVGADALALGASATIELEAAQQIIDAVELASPRTSGHAKRTAAYAAAVAFELGYDGPECARIRLAAHLHQIGMAGADSTAFAPLDELDAGDLAVRRAAPERGAAYARTSAGDEVADIIRCHSERWDGSGYPRGLSQEQIPMGARIVALACRFDELTTGTADGEVEPLEVDSAIAQLGDEGGIALDPGLLVLAAPALSRFTTAG